MSTDEPRTTAGGAVLLADDDPIFLSVMAQRVRLLGAEPIEMQDGMAAWEALTRRPVDVALVDLDMPGLDGIQLIHCIRGFEATRHLPVVVITSHGYGSKLEAALAAGCTAYLTKPLHWTMFGSYVGHLLALSGGRRQALERLEGERQAMTALVEAARSEVAAIMGRRPGEADRAALPQDVDRALARLAERVARLGDEVQEGRRDAA